MDSKAQASAVLEDESLTAAFTLMGQHHTPFPISSHYKDLRSRATVLSYNFTAYRLEHLNNSLICNLWSHMTLKGVQGHYVQKHILHIPYFSKQSKHLSTICFLLLTIM